MHPDVQRLLAVQHDDLDIYALEDRLSSLAPRLAVLEAERGTVSTKLDQARATVAAGEAGHRDALHRLDAHKALFERSQRAYESVKTPKEANAASTQLEQTKRMAAESERDVAQVLEKISVERHTVAEQEVALAEVEERQQTTRATLEAERAAIAVEMATAREKRQVSAGMVRRQLLALYDKVRLRKRSASVFPLRALACGSCDTAIPTQRRAAMMSSGAVELCEGCGVLLYAGE